MPADSMLHNVTSADASRLDVTKGDAMCNLYLRCLLYVPVCLPLLHSYLFGS
jgi:hypothetical protein